MNDPYRHSFAVATEYYQPKQEPCRHLLLINNFNFSFQDYLFAHY